MLQKKKKKKKKKVGTPRVVSGRRRPHASYAPDTRRRGNHMHDHSRFQRDINDVTGVSLSLPLTKVTDAQYRKRFRASYNINTKNYWK